MNMSYEEARILWLKEDMDYTLSQIELILERI